MCIAWRIWFNWNVIVCTIAHYRISCWCYGNVIKKHYRIGYGFLSIKYFGGYLSPTSPTVSIFIFTVSLPVNACIRLICHAIPEMDEICRRHLFRHEKYCLHTVHIDQIQINTILLIRFMCVAYKSTKTLPRIYI